MNINLFHLLNIDSSPEIQASLNETESTFSTRYSSAERTPVSKQYSGSGRKRTCRRLFFGSSISAKKMRLESESGRVIVYYTPRKKRMENKLLKEQIQRLTEENRLLKKQYPEKMSTIAKDLFLNEWKNADRPEHGRRYDPSIRDFSFKVMFYSGSSHRFLRKHFCLPSTRSLFGPHRLRARYSEECNSANKV
jgi:hypothetical protein